MRKVMPSELLLNQPLPWSIYDEHGNLLLKAGHVISIAKHINNLVLRGTYTEAPPPRRQPSEADPTDSRTTDPVTIFQTGNAPRFHPLSVSARVDALAMTLERLHSRVRTQSLPSELRTLIRSLAHAVLEACTDNTDTLLAACHMDRHHTYLVVQQLLSTALVALTAREMDMDDATRMSLVCAALTRDIALLPVQVQLDRQHTPLTAEQIALLRSHPQRTKQMLTEMAIDDPLWLEFVLQHHERLDGSGYPNALQGDAILAGSRLLAITDSYAAMVTPRPNRLGQQPRKALQALHSDCPHLYDRSILQQMSDAVTELPPGTLVRLANGEVGVVRTRQPAGELPDVWLIYNDNGMPLMRPKRCNTTEATYAITDILRVEECRSAALVMKRLWTQS